MAVDTDEGKEKESEKKVSDENPKIVSGSRDANIKQESKGRGAKERKLTRDRPDARRRRHRRVLRRQHRNDYDK